VARKVSDMVLLLGSRGRSRTSSKSALDQVLGRIVRWFSGSSRFLGSSQRERRAPRLPLGVIAVALACFAAGYFVRGQFGPSPAGTEKSLKAQAPGAIGEFDAMPLSKEALIVVGYDRLAPEIARPKAKQMAEFLQARGHKRARPYEAHMEAGSLWLVVVYYDGEAEKLEEQKRLRLLSPGDVNDEFFSKTRADFEKDWPIPYPIQ
jgi:hypothetical protein